MIVLLKYTFSGGLEILRVLFVNVNNCKGVLKNDN
jgi:hypothetical protein